VSLAEELRHELAAVAPERRCDRIAEVSGLFHGAGSVHLRGRGDVSVHLDLADSAVARRAFSLLRELGVESEIRTYRRRAFDRATRYQLHVPGRQPALAVLHEAGVLDAHRRPLEVPPRRVVGRACCRGAYLRGALLAAGSLSGPRAPHLELRTSSLDVARFLARVAADGGGRLAVRDRDRHAIAYAKGAQAIEHVLALAGASGAVLGLEERAVVGQTRAHANRLANADHANLVRAGRAADRQLRAVRALAADGALDDLPAPLRAAAALRVRHPSLALSELARKARPPIPKGTLHRRLARLVRLGEHRS
jgi:DNA-binding protein WhiA